MVHALIIVVSYKDGSSERIEGTTQWDVTTDGDLIAWNDDGDVIAKRDGVATTSREQFRR